MKKRGVTPNFAFGDDDHDVKFSLKEIFGLSFGHNFLQNICIGGCSQVEILVLAPHGGLARTTA